MADQLKKTDGSKLSSFYRHCRKYRKGVDYKKMLNRAIKTASKLERLTDRWMGGECLWSSWVEGFVIIHSAFGSWSLVSGSEVIGVLTKETETSVPSSFSLCFTIQWHKLTSYSWHSHHDLQSYDRHKATFQVTMDQNLWNLSQSSFFKSIILAILSR